MTEVLGFIVHLARFYGLETAPTGRQDDCQAYSDVEANGGHRFTLANLQSLTKDIMAKGIPPAH